MKTIKILCLLGLSLLGFGSYAAESTIVFPLDYQIIRQLLVSELYIGSDESARLWQDGKGCSFLDIAHPQISGVNRQIEMINQVHARLGMQVLGKCVPAIEWRGFVQTLQQPKLDTVGAILSFPVTHINAYDQNQQALNIGELQEVIRKAVQPKLSELKIDLNQQRGQIFNTLKPYIQADDTEKLHEVINSLRFKQVEATEQALRLNLGFTGLKQKKLSAMSAAPVFNETELQKWRMVWQHWQTNLQSRLHQPDVSADDANELQSFLEDADAAFTQALTEDTGNDAVRNFFKDSWQKLLPLLRSTAAHQSGAETLQFLTLISGADVLYHLDNIAKPLGLEISNNGLRNLVRAYLSHQN